MVNFVVEVREVGSCGFKPRDFREGFAYAEVGLVGRGAQAVDDEDFEPFKLRPRGGGDMAAVGYVGRGAEPVAENVELSVFEGDCRTGEASRAEGAGLYGGEGEPGNSSAFLQGDFKYVGKTLFNFRESFFGSVYAYGRLSSKAPEVVYAVEVVCVGVGVEDGAEAGEPRREGLEAEFGGGVYEDFAVYALDGVFDKEGGAGSLVFGVSGGADGAAAAYDGNSVGGSGAQKREFHLRGPLYVRARPAKNRGGMSGRHSVEAAGDFKGVVSYVFYVAENIYIEDFRFHA